MVFHRKNALAVLSVLALLAQALPAAETPLPPEVQHRLEVLQTGFESFVLKSVDTPYHEGLLALNAMAAAALQRENAAAAQRKDLDGLVRLKADLDRLGKGQVLTLANDPPPPALIAIYAAYKLEFARLQSAQKTGFADARQRYDKALAAVQDELTTQQNIDAALRVKHLREELANTEVGMAAAGTAGRGAMPEPREWTYHTTETVGRIAVMAFEPDGTFLMPWKNLKAPHTGTWKATPQPGVFTLVYDNLPEAGKAPVELRITGDKAQLDIPNVGIRYLHAMPPADSAGIAGLWTCHFSPDGVSCGLLTLHPDSRLMLKMKQDQAVQLGTWNDTDQPDVIRITFENYPGVGTAPIEVHFTGPTAELDLPQLGKRYLKFQGGVPCVAARKAPHTIPKVGDLPAEWTYHVGADLYSTAWLRLLPQGIMEWHDRKGVQTGKWRRTAAGFEVDYLNEKTWTVKSGNNWMSADVDRAPGGPSNDFLFVKMPLDQD